MDALLRGKHAKRCSLSGKKGDFKKISKMFS